MTSDPVRRFHAPKCAAVIRASGSARTAPIDARTVAGSYGRMREAWERAVEEILLNGTVERFRRSVETNKLGKLTDIDDEDVKAVVKGMTACSRWLVGHDAAPAQAAPVPEPNEVLNDITSFESWVAAIRKRRK